MMCSSHRAGIIIVYAAMSDECSVGLTVPRTGIYLAHPEAGMADDVPGIKDPSEYAMPTFSSMDTTEEMKGALAVEDAPPENGAGRRVMQSVRSQEEMIHLLPEKNAAFGFK